MTAHFSGRRARRVAHAETRLAGIRAYLGANRTELAYVMRVVGGDHGAAQTAILAGLVARPRPQVARIFALIEEMRDALVSADTEAGDVAPTARSDLDAAVRWHGARLYELLAAG